MPAPRVGGGGTRGFIDTMCTQNGGKEDNEQGVYLGFFRGAFFNVASGLGGGDRFAQVFLKSALRPIGSQN